MDIHISCCSEGGSVSDGDKGDVVVSGSGAVWSVKDSVIKAVLQSYIGVPAAISRWNTEKLAARVFYGGSKAVNVAGISGGTTPGAGRTFFTDNDEANIRQHGLIRTVKVRFHNTAVQANGIRFIVLRPNGSSFDVVSKSEYVTPPGATGQHTYSLTTPMLGQPGDKIAVWIDGHAGAGTLVGSYSADGCYYTASEASTGSEAYTFVGSAGVCIEGYGTPPLIVTAGESILAGHNGPSPYWETLYEGGPVGNLDAEPFNSVRAHIGGLEYQNFCEGGTTWAQTLSKAADIAALAPRAVVVAGGVNDVAQGRSWAMVESEMDAFKAAMPVGTKLFIVEMIPYTPGTDAEVATVRSFNANYAAWCATNGATLISTWGAMGQLRVSTGYNDDMITAYHYSGGHLTVPAGVDAYAALIAEGLQSVLWV